MRILYVTPQLSSPPKNGGEIRKWNILQGLLKAGETDVLYYERPGESDQGAFAGCRRVLNVSSKYLHLGEKHRRRYQSTLGRGLLVLGSPLPIEYQGEDRASLRRTIREQLSLSDYDLVWFATARTYFPLGKLDIPVQILDGDDFGYVREWLLLRNSPAYGAKVWNYLDVAKTWWWERSYSKRFTAVVRCSKQDAERHPGPNVVVIPNGTTVPESIDRRLSPRLLFVGELGYLPNQQGMEWFIREVWPTIRHRLPEARLDVVGRNASPAIEAMHGQLGIEVHGFVKDLDAMYQQAAVSVVPLLAGGGTRLKILESLARGVPVVSTTIGAFGIDLDEAQGLLRADAPDALAKQCIDVLQNARFQEAAMRGREAVKSVYDWKTIQRQVTELALRFARRDDRRDPVSLAAHTAAADGHHRSMGS
jgi:glycosyltransferase involved in cell wall biosynthesis